MLRSKRDDLITRLEQIERDRSRSTAPLSADWAEQATETENDEVLDRLAESTGTALMQVRHAMERIDRNQYGICEHCGARIAQHRLCIAPEVTTCTACSRLQKP